MAIDIVPLKKTANIDTNGLEQLLETMLNDHSLSQDVTCVLTDDAHVHQLNRDYRNKDATTDVLSFEMSDPIHEDAPLGEIYISLNRATEQAAEAKHGLNHEVFHLAIHGVLHLLGYEHDSDKGFEIMQAKEHHYLDIYQHQLKGA